MINHEKRRRSLPALFNRLNKVRKQLEKFVQVPKQTKTVYYYNRTNGPC